MACVNTTVPVSASLHRTQWLDGVPGVETLKVSRCRGWRARPTGSTDADVLISLSNDGHNMVDAGASSRLGAVSQRAMAASSGARRGACCWRWACSGARTCSPRTPAAVTCAAPRWDTVSWNKEHMRRGGELFFGLHEGMKLHKVFSNLGTRHSHGSVLSDSGRL